MVMKMNLNYLHSIYKFFSGIVIKHENMSLKTAVHFAYQMLGLTNKCASVVKGLLDSSDVSFFFLSFFVSRFMKLLHKE